ncbi:hypothetical protein BN2127_JRS3_03493 [Bacillus safensis]|uniref:hypothetical protein n=1 Tax=Bacillus safensis TaxID=561879 RepID=UPI0006A86168|nr:hypothetical protein [Bacillus safensis]CUB23545.1 hypothetical protein BN2127_JRS3_03493 [Bacillus safensis]
MIILEGKQKLDEAEIVTLLGKIQGLLYVRVSTTDQAEKGYSIESQIEMCKERAINKKGEFPSFKRLYGYTFNKESDKPEINEEEKAVLIQMKDMLLYEGMSSNEIASIFQK